ncbi:MFS superfamily sulfate permease-like transporter [Conyzicola lurida]|uniref:MFS superfamily sulfate permease-like transporter n=1 Tax=Conyzicola lurida TaxID=1172621 RepID=A0A841AMB6_9MICO|nr:SulP family inorganic anion transporter [Conyzicola lurida]MBB5843468.1 MFS superfamily sulfate permease-like transporter [Conyzicola lurida]
MRVSEPSGWLAPTLRGYRRRWLSADIVAGLSAGAVVIPQAMAYATIADLPVQAGLYTCITPMVVYALLGGSRAMSVSTTSTIATLTATTLVSAGVAASAEDQARDLATLTLLVGVILVLARVFRLGALVENINEPTLIGLKVGLGATVALGQVPKLLGVDVEVTGHGFVRTLAATLESVPEANLATALLSAGSIVVLVALRQLAPRVPAQLVVVVGGILLVALTGIADAGVRVIEPVPTGLPLPGIPSLTDVGVLIPGALAIAVMAFLESASVARGIRLASEPQVDSNRELFATGAANLVGAFFHTLPAAGGFSQSAVNQRAGARSQLASIVTAALAVLVALFLAPVLDDLPQAVLASMVLVAVVGLIDVRGLVRLARLSRIEFWVAVAAALIGLSAGLLAAVAAGVLFTLGLVLHGLNQPRITVGPAQGGVLPVRLDVPLYTANVFATQRAVEDALASAGDIHTLHLDVSVLKATSVTVLDALAGYDHELAQRGVRLEVAGLEGDALALARRTEWWGTLAEQGRARDG